jgi:hypothetical protein
MSLAPAQSTTNAAKMTVPSSSNVAKKDLFLSPGFVQTGKLQAYNAIFGVDSTDVFDSNSLRRLETKLATQVNAAESGFKIEPDGKPIRVVIEPLIRWKVNERLGSRNISGPIIVTSDQVDATQMDQKQQILVCFLEIDVTKEALVAFRQRFCNAPIDGAIARGTCLFYNGAETSKPYTDPELNKMPIARREIHDRLKSQFFASGPALFRVIYPKEPVSLEMGLFDVEKISGISYTSASSGDTQPVAPASASSSIAAAPSAAKRKAPKKKKAREAAEDDEDDCDDDDSEDELIGSAKSKQVVLSKGKQKKGAVASTTIVSKSSDLVDAKTGKPVKVPQGAVPFDAHAGEKIISNEAGQILEWCSSCLRTNSFHITLTMRGFVRAENVFAAVAFQPGDFGRSFFIVHPHHLGRRPRLTTSSQSMVTFPSELALLNTSVVLNQQSEIHKTNSTELDEASNGPGARNSRHAAPAKQRAKPIFEKHLLDTLEFIDVARMCFGEMIKATRHRLRVLMIVTDFYENEIPNGNHLYVRNYPGGYDAPLRQDYVGAPGLMGKATPTDYAAVALASICVIVKGDDDLIDWFLRAERFLISARDMRGDPLLHLQRIKNQIDRSTVQTGATPLSQLFLLLRAELVEDLFEVDDGSWAPIEDVTNVVTEPDPTIPAAPIDSDDVISLFGEDEDFADQFRLDESTVPPPPSEK